MARSRNTADTQTASGGPVSPSIAGKNALINGGMDIWQRGTSTTVASTGKYTADRWGVYCNGSVVISQDTTTLAPNTQYSLKAVPTATNFSVTQSIETSNAVRFAGQDTVFTVYLASSANMNMTVYVNYSTVADVNPFGSFTTITTGTAATTSTMTRFTFSAAIPSTAKTISVSVVPDSSSNSIYMGAAQLEIGKSATPFSRAGGTIQGELAACQRYYTRFAGGSGASCYGQGQAYTAAAVAALVPLPVTMRVTPTAVDYATMALTLIGTGDFSITGLSIDTGTSGPNTVVVLATGASGLTLQRIYSLKNTATNSYLGFSAEL